MFKKKNETIAADGTKQAAKNTFLLYLMTIAKLIFPLFTLPYLTRVLTTDSYGAVTYVKSYVSYVQLFVDFGFILSAVSDIIRAGDDKRKIGYITGHVILAKLLIGLAWLGISFGVIYAVPILRAYKLYTMLSVVGAVLTALLADFLFRGIEKMHVVTVLFVTMRGIATALTFVFVHGDGDLLWIPILEIVGVLAAVSVSFIFIAQYKIPIRICSLRVAFRMIRTSFIYFASNIATTAFGALNTFLIGIFILDSEQIAFWGVAMQLITAVQNLYAPIINGIYPQMIRSKSAKLIRNVLLLFMPIVLLGCLFCFFAAKWILLIVGGAKYIAAVPIFRYLLPILFFSFPGMLFGWPTLGAIGHEKQVTVTTVTTAAIQVLGLFLLILFGQFTLINIALLRGATELFMLLFRMGLLIRNRRLLN
ncbi:MAG: oligosaccharide flippase family protein [Clostridia bacterium]|nr:oligosaccharide flippase family protein [Clostridia bacterium]